MSNAAPVLHYLYPPMKRKKRTQSKRSRRLLVLTPVLAIIAAGAWLYAPEVLRKKQVATPEISYDPHFAPVPADFRDQHLDSIRSFFEKRLLPEDFQGMVLFAKNGEVIYERYSGMANEAEGLRMSAETPVHVASISKTITAVTVLRLVDQGKIKLDEQVRTYLPELPYKGITVRMLLNHRSGIQYYGYFSDTLWSPKRPLTNKAILQVLKKHRPKLYFPSNTQFSYCNTNYALLALMVEKITGRSFPDAVSKLVFEPLGMTHSFIYTPKRKAEKRALSYNSRSQLQEDNYLDLVYGDKNLYTTARDLLRFDKGTYSEAFLSKKIKAELFKGYSYENPGKANYGLGIRMREEKGKTTCYFHTGWWHGNTGCYTTLRKDTICMIVLSNHYTRRVFGINRLSALFGNYPFELYFDPAGIKDPESEE